MEPTHRIKKRSAPVGADAPTVPPDGALRSVRGPLVGLWRLAVVAAVAIGAFALGLSRFPDARFLACTMRADIDPAYSARISLPPTMSPIARKLFLARQSQGVAVRLVVNRNQNATPSRSARVCIVAFPVTRSWLGVSDEAQRVAPGQYDALLGFDSLGAWGARVVVVEPGQRPVAIPINFSVPFPLPATPSTPTP